MSPTFLCVAILSEIYLFISDLGTFRHFRWWLTANFMGTGIFYIMGAGLHSGDLSSPLLSLFNSFDMFDAEDLNLSNCLQLFPLRKTDAFLFPKQVIDLLLPYLTNSCIVILDLSWMEFSIKYTFSLVQETQQIQAIQKSTFPPFFWTWQKGKTNF